MTVCLDKTNLQKIPDSQILSHHVLVFVLKKLVPCALFVPFSFLILSYWLFILRCSSVLCLLTDSVFTLLFVALLQSLVGFFWCLRSVHLWETCNFVGIFAKITLTKHLENSTLN